MQSRKYGEEAHQWQHGLHSCDIVIDIVILSQEAKLFLECKLSDDIQCEILDLFSEV
jgi:hypothetical protein